MSKMIKKKVLCIHVLPFKPFLTSSLIFMYLNFFYHFSIFLIFLDEQKTENIIRTSTWFIFV